MRGGVRQTRAIESACVELCESRFDRLLLSVIDTPGLDFAEGRELTLERQVSGIVKYLDEQYADTMSEVRPVGFWLGAVGWGGAKWGEVGDRVLGVARGAGCAWDADGSSFVRRNRKSCGRARATSTSICTSDYHICVRLR